MIRRQTLFLLCFRNEQFEAVYSICCSVGCESKFFFSVPTLTLPTFPTRLPRASVTFPIHLLPSLPTLAPDRLAGVASSIGKAHLRPLSPTVATAQPLPPHRCRCPTSSSPTTRPRRPCPALLPSLWQLPLPDPPPPPATS